MYLFLILWFVLFCVSKNLCGHKLLLEVLYLQLLHLVLRIISTSSL